MTDHLQEAREFVGCAENFSSPDDRSAPFALHGILHALIAIAERMPEPTRPMTPEELQSAARDDEADIARHEAEVRAYMSANRGGLAVYWLAHEAARRTGQLHKLVADFQANGNSRELGDPTAGAWLEAAQQVLDAIAGWTDTAANA